MKYKNHGEIYTILNIVEWKAYVGQSCQFNRRDHAYELEKGIDSFDLQLDYQNSQREFVYMVLYSDYIQDYEELNRYERFYMSLLEKFKFNLYNQQCNNSVQARENREVDNLKISAEFCSDAQDRFLDDFVKRFGIEPQVVFNAGRDGRQEALNTYVSKRLGSQTFIGDRFIFNRRRIQEIVTKKIGKDSPPLDLDEVFISKFGNYLGEGVDQILNYECETQKRRKYCLWTFAANAVSYETVKKHCEKRQKEHLETYVLFEYTASTVYACAEAKRFSKLRKKNASKLTNAEMKFLTFNRGKYGHFYVPDDIDCTATGKSSVNAFVISDFYLLDDVYNMNEIKKRYKAVCKDGLKDIDKIGYQRSTYFMSSNQTGVRLSDITKEASTRNFCLIGKLAAPYIVPLECVE